MIMCPSCQHQEVEGAMFCSECGMSLQNLDAFGTQNIKTDEINQDILSSPPRKEPSDVLSHAHTLQILDGGQLLPLSDRKEYTMGRVSEGQPVMPDIDLTPYRAYENGVSRIHAVLKREKGKAYVMDLGSSNGTYLDGVRLTPEQEYPLSHGSILSLGKLKIQFLTQK